MGQQLDHYAEAERILARVERRLTFSREPLVDRQADDDQGDEHE